METSVRQHVHSVTLRTLHSHNFTRTSSQASTVLTDVVVRFIDLLALTSVQHAEHAGRRGVNVFDAVAALEDVGMGIEELMEFVEGEGRDIARYSLVKASGGGEQVVAAAGPSTVTTTLTAGNDMLPAVSRRIDSLADIKSSLSQGARIDSDDAILLRYERIATPDLSQTASPHESPSPLALGTPSSSPSSNGFHSLPNMLNGARSSKGKQREVEPTLIDMDAMDISPVQQDRRPVTPTLPLSPVSNPAYSPPSSPTRKRPRSLNWNPPPHVPDFLPPFPGQDTSSSQKEKTSQNNKSSSFTDPSLNTLSPRQRPPPPPRLPLLSSVKSSYTKSIPYSVSSLAASSTGYDLPPDTLTSTPSSQPLKPSASLQLLISAYNMLQSETLPATNPSRLKVAHYLARTAPQRYSNPDTLFGGTSPNLPRSSAPLPTHPVPLDPNAKGTLPPPQPKPINDRNGGEGGAGGFDLSMPHLQSNLSKLAKELLAPGFYSRTTQLPPPPPLLASATISINSDPGPTQSQPQMEPVLYSKPIMAPWNSEAASSVGDKDDEDGGKPSLKKKNRKGNEKAGADGAASLPDAKLYATWDWTSKEWTEPLVARRGRMDSFSLGGNTSSSGAGAAAWVGSPVVGTPGGMLVPIPIVAVKSPMLGAKKGTDDTVVATPATPVPSGKIRAPFETPNGVMVNGHTQQKNVILVNGHSTTDNDEDHMDSPMMVDVKMNGTNSVLSASS
ncbi:hypothetical protein FRC03_001812 [Tulasnella sp. 419]|nr:hypothetical protein FRC03_001812 [Tulasnella sp. 419]